MTRAHSNAMMFATVSGCAQAAFVRIERSSEKPTDKPQAKAASRRAKARAKSRAASSKRS